MNDLGNSGYGAIADREPADQRLEGAAVAFVSEAGAEHVEGQRITRAGGVADESKPCLRIDESSDQPCGGHSIHARPRPSDPETAIVMGGVRSVAAALFL